MFFEKRQKAEPPIGIFFLVVVSSVLFIYLRFPLLWEGFPFLSFVISVPDSISPPIHPTCSSLCRLQTRAHPPSLCWVVALFISCFYCPLFPSSHCDVCHLFLLSFSFLFSICELRVQKRTEEQRSKVQKNVKNRAKNDNKATYIRAKNESEEGENESAREGDTSRRYPEKLCTVRVEANIQKKKKSKRNEVNK